MCLHDVNSASDPGEGNRRETVIRTNLEACQEIMIQARLRNLSGILILDMIDMDDEKDRSLILEVIVFIQLKPLYLTIVPKSYANCNIICNQKLSICGQNAYFFV